MTPRIPLVADRLEDPEVAAVLACLRTGWLTLGPRTQELELDLATRLAVDHAVALSTGTAALKLAFVIAGIKPGDGVVLAAIARPAAHAAARSVGAVVALADVGSLAEPVLDPDGLRRQLTRGHRAVLVSHPWGYPAPSAALRKVCDEAGVVLIEDATEAMGAETAGPDGSRAVAGTIGHVGCYSLAWGRQLGIGQGGVLTTADAELAARARLLRSHALTATTWDRHRGHSDSYDVVDIGFNFRIDEPRAALAMARLPGLTDQVELRRAADRRYREHIAATAPVWPAFSAAIAATASPLVFPLLTSDGVTRERLADELGRQGIETARRPALDDPAGAPATQELSRRLLGLPLRPWRESSEQDQVIEAVNALPY